MFCESCGKTIDDNALFCRHCGAKVENEAVKNNVQEKVEIIPEKITIKTFIKNLGGESGNKTLDNMATVINIAIIVFAIANLIAVFLPVVSAGGKNINMSDCMKMPIKNSGCRLTVPIVASILSIVICAEKVINNVHIWGATLVVGVLDIVWYASHVKWLNFGGVTGIGTILYLICGAGMVLTVVARWVLSYQMIKYKESVEYCSKLSTDDSGRSKLI